MSSVAMNRGETLLSITSALSSDIMKKLLIITALFAFFAGCNANESKEARLRKLEKEAVVTRRKLQDLEDSVQAVEALTETVSRLQKSQDKD